MIVTNYNVKKKDTVFLNKLGYFTSCERSFAVKFLAFAADNRAQLEIF